MHNIPTEDMIDYRSGNWSRCECNVSYNELTKWPALSWFDSSVGRVVHQYSRDRGLESRSSLFVVVVVVRLYFYNFLTRV